MKYSIYSSFIGSSIFLILVVLLLSNKGTSSTQLARYTSDTEGVTLQGEFVVDGILWHYDHSSTCIILSVDDVGISEDEYRRLNIVLDSIDTSFIVNIMLQNAVDIGNHYNKNVKMAKSVVIWDKTQNF